jgi:hypothetical protein
MYSPGISLAIARERAMEARRAIAQGQDPPTVKPEKKKLTFQEAAEALIAAKRNGWRNAKHGAQWTSTLVRYVFPELGSLEAQTISTDNVLAPHCSGTAIVVRSLVLSLHGIGMD